MLDKRRFAIYNVRIATGKGGADMQCEQMEQNLNQFERLARKVQSRPEEEQRDICLIIQGYLACSASKERTKVS